MKNYSKAYYILAAAFIALFFGNLVYGTIGIPVKEVLNIFSSN